MRKMFAVAVLASLLVGLAVFAQLWVGREDPAVEDAIRGQVEQINRAWESADGAAIMAEILSEKFTASLPHPAKPGDWIVLDKSQFCNAFQRTLAENRPKRHEHRISRIVTFGGVVHEVGISLDLAATGKRREDEILNVWKQEGDSWRLILSTHTSMLKQSLGIKGG